MARVTPALSSTFWVGEPATLLTASDAQWRLPLPADRHSGFSTFPTVSYGDYFTAVADYLNGEGRTALALAVRHHLGQDFNISQPADIQIHLVKHGAFYHPARVSMTTGAQRLAVVLNVAVSPAGRELLTAEAADLRRLGDDFSESFIPRVYGWGTGCSGGHEPLPMFLGEWLSGFHELHPAAGPHNRRSWVVWDPDQGRWHLSQRQAADLFRQAVFILTYYFDPHTLEAIQAWHHAAGDFVVRAQGDGLEVRLITVRRYTPLFQLEPEEALTVERLLEALAVYLLRTSLWMRLDRLDGVGDLTWAGDFALKPMWEGFAQGLESMARRNDFPENFVPGVIAYLAGYARDEWLVLGETIIARFPAELPETALLRRHLVDHVDGLVRVIAAQEF